jgi:hypothetical protein
MTPRDFLADVVEPNIEEAKGGEDIRTIYNAAASVDSLAAHIFEWCKVHAPQEVHGLKADSEYRAWAGRRHTALQ